MFKHADPTRRTPVYLQAYTKENIVWQLKLTAVFILGTYVWGRIQEYREINRFPAPKTDNV